MKSLRKCFISAAYGEDVSVLQHVLEQLEASWEWALASPTQGALSESVVRGIKQAEFVIGILREDVSNDNVLVELGIAIGLDKPLLLFTVGDVGVPSELFGYSMFATDLKDPKLLTFQVDVFLKSLDRRTHIKRGVPFPSSMGISDLPAPKVFGSAIEQTVAAAIVNSGGRVTIPAHAAGETVPDLLMWLPQQDKDLFNPAAVKVLSGAKDSHVDLAMVQQRLFEFVFNSQLRCGLMVVNSVSLEKEIRKLTQNPLIYALNLRQFRELLESSGLSHWVRRERNRLAHGVR